MMGITLEDLRAICPLSNQKRLATFVEPLNAAMQEFGINTLPRQAAFLAQLAHESGGFFYVREIASGAAYEGREDLGNTRAEAITIAAEHNSSPGRWWKGHGLIQITGFDNHAECSEALYGDRLVLLHEPSRLEQPLDAARSAAWFWSAHDLNQLADVGDFKRITRTINGGLRGYTDRLTYWERAQERLV